MKPACCCVSDLDVQGLSRRGLQLEALKEFILSQGASKNVTLQDWEKVGCLSKSLLHADLAVLESRHAVCAQQCRLCCCARQSCAKCHAAQQPALQLSCMPNAEQASALGPFGRHDASVSVHKVA